MQTFKCPFSKDCLFHGSFQDVINEKPVSIIGTSTCEGFLLINFLCFSSAPSVLTLTAVRHLLSGVIKTLTQTNDITVNIRSDFNVHIFSQLSPSDPRWMLLTPR